MTVMGYTRDASAICISGSHNGADPFFYYGTEDYEYLDMEILYDGKQPDQQQWHRILKRFRPGTSLFRETEKAFRKCYRDVLMGDREDWKLRDAVIEYGNIKFTYENPNFDGNVSLVYNENLDERDFKTAIKILGPKPLHGNQRPAYCVYSEPSLKLATDCQFNSSSDTPQFVVFEDFGFINRTISIEPIDRGGILSHKHVVECIGI